MNVLPVLLGKLILLFLRACGRRGTALPGLVVEKVFPNFLPRRLAQLPLGVVVISGTNGKTTTTKMLSTILSEKYSVLTNDSGGNFIRGVLTSLIAQSSWSGRLSAEVAVLELDEAHAVRFAHIHPPERLLLLNVLRDQLDRFGEIDTTAGILAKVARQTTRWLVLNRDDPRLVALSSKTPAESSFFGVAPNLRAEFPTDEEMYGAAIELSNLSAAAELLTLQLGVTTELSVRIDGSIEQISLKAEGAHNAQNAAAAAAMALTFGLTPDEIARGLRAVEPAFGRGQTFEVDGRRLVLQLVKNPAGFRQSLRTLDGFNAAATVIVINDDDADGRDMSWLWDVPFTEALIGKSGKVIVSGTRATDMAVRLRYDEVTVHTVQPDVTAAITDAVRSVQLGQVVVVFSSYTAMWALHGQLTSSATGTRTTRTTGTAGAAAGSAGSAGGQA